ncbi:P-loop containing nucleoside triphosphate hydrolase protein [Rostrohypoxylon terebratum]|nr:P-loop containing nucleoside triphosphate hydrolase protein [Rostrohypoxylon terebratum]
MGQLNSKLIAGTAAPNVPKDRIQVAIPNTGNSVSALAPIDGPRIDPTPQNSIEEQAPRTPPPKHRRDSTRAPSSSGCYANTVVDSESPASPKHHWNRGYSMVNFPTHRPSPSDNEAPSSICSLINGEQAFRRHPRKPSLEIVCPNLNELFRAITDPLIKYQGASRLPRFIVNEPYELIFHIRKKILQSQHQDTDDHSKDHVQALFDFIQKKSPVAWEKLDEINDGRCYDIAFKELWLLYPPGETVFNRDEGEWRSYKVDRIEINSELNPESLVIHCWFLDFDKTGKWLVPQMKAFCVPSYSSERPIKTLDVIPHWCCDKLSQKLIERGNDYWKYGHVVSYKQYDGDAWPRAPQEGPLNVIVDYVTSSKHRQDVGPNKPQCGGVVCSICQAKAVQLEPYPSNAPHDSEVCGITQAVSYSGHATKEESTNFLMFCPARMWAFSLRHKSWKIVQVQELSEVQSQCESFDKLQIKNDRKKDLERVICGHFKNSNGNLDLIMGKGLGLNVLLHGNPGTGKTLTVESLCEKNRIPLYMLTCGELGNDTDAFEDRLQIAFLRAANWRAILLLEEADIFIRRREREIQHCAIVSSFLNKLDYSQAVVFMATNRIKVLDEALISRVHIMLEFPDFNFSAQQEIWKDAISRLRDVKQDDRNQLEFWVGEELSGQGPVNMNGRQIRNCISAAVALAQGREENWDGSLKVLDVRKVLSLGKEFMEFVRQGDNPDIGAMMEARDRKAILAQQAAP